MIDINLIPAALRKNGKGNANSLTINIPKEILVGCGVRRDFAFGDGPFDFGGGMVDGDRAVYQLIRPIGRNYRRIKTILDAINNESKDLKKKINMISDMTTKKSVLWAPKFNAISDALAQRALD